MQPQPPTPDDIMPVMRQLEKAVEAGQAIALDEPADDTLLSVLDTLEMATRRLDALRLTVLAEADRRGLGRADGHATTRIMVRHRCRLSGPEAARRMRSMRALRDLPIVAGAFRQGELGSEQLNVIALVHANPRVRSALIGFQDDLVALGSRSSFPDFEQAVRAWERLADDSGPEPRPDAAHRNRFLRLRQNPGDLSWDLNGRFGPLQGARIHQVLKEFTHREWEADWAQARAIHGEAASAAQTERTDAQRAADAFEHLTERAAAAPPDTGGPVTVHNIVWDAETYHTTLHRLACTDTACDRAGHQPGGRWYEPATYRCETVDGHPLDPVEAAIASLDDRLRTILVSGGVPTHVGRARRLFTGHNRLAVQLQHHHCVWPGCWVPTTECQADHILAHTRGGATEPSNGAPLCGRHNRWKQRGFTLTRDPGGGWHTHRPDGTEIP